jgi:isoleucyl-tRNA synthetase
MESRSIQSNVRGSLTWLTTARQRLEAHVLSRSEWCISRQRSWGVPIPALYDTKGDPLLDSNSMEHIISVLEEKGTEHWWKGDVKDFTPPAHVGETLTKGVDTLDVWFDSGSSWTMLEEVRKQDHSAPLADVYLEGSDQHRGWFQSSLLTKLGASIGEETVAPYRNLITHGFVLDEKGQKMSKSSGNGLSPSDIINGSKVSCATTELRPGHAGVWGGHIACLGGIC